MNSSKLQRSYKVDKENLKANIKWAKGLVTRAKNEGDSYRIKNCTDVVVNLENDLKQLEEDYEQLNALLNKYHLMD